jgi:hypothetical protein
MLLFSSELGMAWVFLARPIILGEILKEIEAWGGKRN